MGSAWRLRTLVRMRRTELVGGRNLDGVGGDSSSGRLGLPLAVLEVDRMDEKIKLRHIVAEKGKAPVGSPNPLFFQSASLVWFRCVSLAGIWSPFGGIVGTILNASDFLANPYFPHGSFKIQNVVSVFSKNSSKK